MTTLPVQRFDLAGRPAIFRNVIAKIVEQEKRVEAGNGQIDVLYSALSA
jgi:hypothetical protein